MKRAKHDQHQAAKVTNVVTLPHRDHLRRLLASALIYHALVDPLSPADVLPDEPEPERQDTYQRWQRFNQPKNARGPA